jgi:hypothetical protein
MDRRIGAALALGSATAHAASGGAATKVVGAAAAIKWTGIALLAIGGAGYVGWRASHPPASPSPMAIVAAPAATDPEPAPVGQGVAAAGPEPATRAETEPPEDPGAPRASTAPRASHPKASEETLSAELDLLHDAQSKWRAGNASAALSLLSEHKKRFPRSQLGSERDALTILSLCATNRTAEARRLAQRFLQTAQRSPLRTSVEESCGGRL